MQAKLTKLKDLMAQPDTKFVVPIYQRVYSWTKPELRSLWNSVLNAGREDKSLFLGTAFFLDEGENDGLRILDVIDGQQRLTTITLMLAAVRNRMQTEDLTFCGMDAIELQNTCLKVREGGKEGCKLVLSRADAPTLQEIVGVDSGCGGAGGTKNASGAEDADCERSKYVMDAYRWFADQVSSTELEWSDLERGFEQTGMIVARMEKNDRPQAVFESLNSKGLPLSVPDLVRNSMFGRDGFESPSYLYDKYWVPVEDAFSEDGSDRFLAHAVRKWSGANFATKDERGIFAAFKARFLSDDPRVLEKRAENLAMFCINFHDRIAEGDEATLSECTQWEESIGKAERLRNNRKIFGD